MNRRLFFNMIFVIVLLGAVIGLGIYAYNAGVAQGLMQGAQIEPGAVPALAYPYYAPPFWGPHGFGFLGCLLPLFLVMLFFFALRGLAWHGPHGWGRMQNGMWGGSPMRGKHGCMEAVPPMVEEWHRKMHESPKPAVAEADSTEQL